MSAPQALITSGAVATRDAWYAGGTLEVRLVARRAREARFVVCIDHIGRWAQLARACGRVGRTLALLASSLV